MRISSILENQKIEKRISITPEIAKKYISLGLEVSLPENYGNHLGIKDNEYKEIGVLISKDEKEIINSADIIVQLGLPDDDKSSFIKNGQTVRMHHLFTQITNGQAYLLIIFYRLAFQIASNQGSLL